MSRHSFRFEMFCYHQGLALLHSFLINFILGYIDPMKYREENHVLVILNQTYRSQSSWSSLNWHIHLWDRMALGLNHSHWLIRIIKGCQAGIWYNSLPGIFVVVWRWLLDSDGWKNHENQFWASCLLGGVSEVVIKAVVTMIELIVEMLIISS